VYFVIPVKLKNPENVYCLFFISIFIELHFIKVRGQPNSTHIIVLIKLFSNIPGHDVRANLEVVKL